MGVSEWSQAERDLYALGSRQLLDNLDRQIEEWQSSAALDTTSTDDMTREHNARMRQLEENHKAWLARFLSGDDEGAHTDVQPAPQGASSGRGPATPATVPAGLPNLDPRAAELADRRRAQEMAAAVRDMDLSDYAQLRAELHIGQASARGLFDS